MEKLVNLLNEYDKSENVNAYRWEIEWGDIIWYNRFRWGYETINVSESVIISKWYEFIKRLVDNNKIDTGWKITEDLTYQYFQIPRKYFRWGKYARLSEEMNDIFYHRILACLSIQDKPIEFLISILK